MLEPVGLAGEMNPQKVVLICAETCDSPHSVALIYGVRAGDGNQRHWVDQTGAGPGWQARGQACQSQTCFQGEEQGAVATAVAGPCESALSKAGMSPCLMLVE